MKTITTHYQTLTFGSFVKICASLGISFGLVYGVFNFLYILVKGVSPYMNKPTGSYLTTLIIGAIMIAVTPLISGLIGVIFSCVLYLPFTFVFMPLQNGITLSGKQK